MSNLFSNILKGATKEFAAAESAIEGVWTKLTTALPFLKPQAAAAVAALKQQASNAFAFADTELAAHYADAVSMAESAADTLVMGMTRGLAAPAIPLVNVGLTQGFALLHAALDHAEAEVKAKLGLPPATSDAAPSVGAGGAAVVAAVTAQASAQLAHAAT